MSPGTCERCRGYSCTLQLVDADLLCGACAATGQHDNIDSLRTRLADCERSLAHQTGMAAQFHADLMARTAEAEALRRERDELRIAADKADWWEKHARMMARAADTEKAEAKEMCKQRDAAIARADELASILDAGDCCTDARVADTERQTAEAIAAWILSKPSGTWWLRGPDGIAADIRAGLWRKEEGK